MSTDGSIVISWPDDERKFRLGIGELRELQDKCDAGPAEIYKAIAEQKWRFDHIRETIRLGLIGGGTATPQQALAIVGRYVVPGSLVRCAVIAQTILVAALVGDMDEEKKSEDTPPTAKVSGNGTTSHPSTDQEQSSGGHHAKSINAHSQNS